MNPAVHRKQVYFLGFASLFVLAFAGAVQFENRWFAFLPFIALIFYAGWKEPQTLFFLLLFCIPFSFEFNFSSSLGTDLPDEPLMWIVSLLFFIRFSISEPGFRTNVFSHPLVLLLLAWVCWMVFSMIFSSNQMLSAKYVLAKTWYMGAFVLPALLLFAKKKNILTAVTILLTSVSIVTLFILYRHALTGFKFETANDAARPFFRNHVNYAAMLVCMLPVLVGLHFLAKNPFQKKGLIIAGLFLLTALAFSYSRGAWLALVIGMIAYGLIRKRLLLLSYILACILTIGIAFWLKSDDRYLSYAPDYKTTIFHKDFSRHLVSTYQLKDLSTAERFYRWIAGVRMLKQYWLSGTGPNTFYPLYKEYTVPVYKTWVSNNPEHSGVHNYFLLTAVEQGLPGLLFLLLLLGAIIYYTEKGYHRSKIKDEQVIYMVTGVMISMIILLNCLSDLVETDKIGSLFFLCIGLLVAVDTWKLKDSESSPDIERVP